MVGVGCCSALATKSWQPCYNWRKLSICKPGSGPLSAGQHYRWLPNTFWTTGFKSWIERNTFHVEVVIANKSLSQTRHSKLGWLTQRTFGSDRPILDHGTSFIVHAAFFTIFQTYLFWNFLLARWSQKFTHLNEPSISERKVFRNCLKKYIYTVRLIEEFMLMGISDFILKWKMKEF